MTGSNSASGINNMKVNETRSKSESRVDYEISRQILINFLPGATAKVKREEGNRKTERTKNPRSGTKA